MPKSRAAHSNSTLDANWRRWVAESKLLGVEDAVVVSNMSGHGITPEAAAQEVASTVSHPYFLAGQALSQRLRKLEEILRIQHQLVTLAKGQRQIERRVRISTDEFLENYYARNRPIILTDVMEGWHAPSKWTSEFFKSVLGNEMVEIMAERNDDPNYERDYARHSRQIRFGEYVDLVEKSRESNDNYLVANNRFMDRTRMQILFEDIKFPAFLDPNRRAQNTFFWYGPGGTVTPLHHDTMNILMTQVRGRKEIKLVSPEQTPLVYNSIGVFSDVDCENPDYQRHPLFKSADIWHLELRAGEALFLPVGWWHHVRALETSITLTFTNFVYPNKYHWSHLHIPRYRE